MRLIDADALIDKAKEYGGYYEDTVYAVPLADISDAPSIDIVFCKECKYRDKHHYCGIWGQPYLCNDECFCSYGEREGE